MKTIIIATAMVLGTSVAAFAQSFPLPTHNEQLAADIASYATLGVGIGLDVKQCFAPESNRNSCLTKAGIRYGTVVGVDEILKRVFHRPRPCAPGGCGIDSDNSNTPSGHAALAFASISWNPSEEGAGKRFAVQLSLASLTAAFRGGAKKHDLEGLVVGALVGGWASYFIR